MMAYSPPLPLRPPPPPPPPLQIGNFAAASSSGSAPSSLNLSPSVLIIFAILAFVFLASVAIHLLLRFLSRYPDSSFRSRASVSASASASASASSAAAPASTEASAAKEVSDGEKATLIERLPLFTLASALSSLPKSSPDCAVCQDPFRPDDELRLLPACCHAFHSRCVDPWLRSTLLCPLCRSSISLPFPPLILPPPPTAAAAASTTTTTTAAAAPPIDDDPSLGAAPRSGSFRIEMGTVSRRRTDPEDAGTTQAPHTIRSYAMESYDYMVEEEVEAVISVIPPRRTDAAAAAAAAAAKEEKPTEGSGRYRVKDRLDRFTASASSSFNSLRWSNRYDDGGGGGGGGGGWWDLEGSQTRDGDEGGGGGGLYAFYRWITGV